MTSKMTSHIKMVECPFEVANHFIHYKFDVKIYVFTLRSWVSSCVTFAMATTAASLKPKVAAIGESHIWEVITASTWFCPLSSKDRTHLKQAYYYYYYDDMITYSREHFPPFNPEAAWFQQSTWCLPPCGSTSWPAQSSPAAHTQRFVGGNAPWPLPHSVPPEAPPAGNACPLRHSALGYPSAAWGRKEWPADESASAGRGMLGCKCPDVERRERQGKEWRTKDNYRCLHYIYTYAYTVDDNHLSHTSYAVRKEYVTLKMKSFVELFK